jgi:hypothetical protein
MFFICLQQAGRARSRILLYTMEHGMSTGSLRMSDLKRCCVKTQIWCPSRTKCFLCGMKTTTSRLGCHTLTWWWSILAHICRLCFIQHFWRACGIAHSHDWLEQVRPPHFDWFLKMVFSYLSPMFGFSNSCVGVLSLIVSSQTWCMSPFTFKGLESYPWSNSRMFCQHMSRWNVRTSQWRPNIPWHWKPFLIMCTR